MNSNDLIEQEERIQNTIRNKYVKLDLKSKPIYDGVVNPEQYVSSCPRILWVLKEAYDGGMEYNRPDEGGWSLAGLLNDEPHRMSRGRAFQPICYVDYGIRNKIYDWNSASMPYLRDCEQMRLGIRNIAFINVSKMPGLRSSPLGRIEEAYGENRSIILDQIKTYLPHVIFACSPHADLLLKDLAPGQKWQEFGSASAVMISPVTRFVRVRHPSQRGKRGVYVNDAIRVAVVDLPSIDILPNKFAGANVEATHSLGARA